MTAGRAVLTFTNVSKHFGAVVAVRRLSESIAPGEYFCIVGPSGCGKTTLLRMTAGFEEPTGGDIELDGARMNAVPPENRDVNIVFQNYALFPHMSVFENVAFGLRAKRMRADAITRRVDEALALVRLGEQSKRMPREISGGQQQRVALARALVMRPRVLLLDEPLSALDRHLRLAMQEELRRIHRETGLTFLHITHDQGEALALGSRVAVMRAGEFLQVDTPEALYRRPRHAFVAEFVGTNNVVHAQVASVDPPCVRVGDVVLRSSSMPGAMGQSAIVSVRPEAIQVNGTGQPSGNTFAVEVTSVAFAGAVIELTVRSGQHSWIAHVPARSGAGSYRPGMMLQVRIDPADITVIADDA